MTTFLQLHLLTSYPPANLNRDDSGAPKTAIFGGVQRLRVSSQSLKRAWRTSDLFAARLKGMLATRTQRVGARVRDILLAKGMEPEKAIAIGRSVAAIAGSPTKKAKADQTYTDQLVFLTPNELGNFDSFAEEIARDSKLANELISGAGEIEEDEMQDNEDYDLNINKKSNNKKGLSKKKIATLRNRLLLRTDGAADAAMFGRMMAASPAFNFEASVQVAHAISTHKVVLEDDYYVAVDDLKNPADREDAGTSFIGVQEYAAGLFYLYICADLNLLVKNLNGDTGLARDTLAALVESAAQVAPKGKQASFASRARASYILAEAGSEQPRTLATAFLKPVGVTEEGGDQALASTKRLMAFRDKLNAVYGAGDLQTAECDTTGNMPIGTLANIVDFARKAVPVGAA